MLKMVSKLKKNFRHSAPREFFHVCIINRNHMGFFVQFEINFLLRVFQKAEIALSEAASAISPF